MFREFLYSALWAHDLVLWVRARIYVRAFRVAGAIGPGNAKRLDELQLDDFDTVDRLIADGILVRSGDWKLHLDEEGLKASRRNELLLGLAWIALCTVPLVLLGYC